MIERVVYVGQQIDTTVIFVEDGTVIQPVDSNLYPNYLVKDINGDVVSFGIASLNPDHSYHATFTIPIDCSISTPTNKWTIDWEMVSLNGKSYKQTEHFDVALPSFSMTDFKEQQKMTLYNFPIILHLPLPTFVSPSTISFTLTEEESGTVVFSGSPSQEGIYNELYVYKITVPSNTTKPSFDYHGLWSFQLNNTTSEYFVKLYSVNAFLMSVISDLRMFLDKTLKPLDLYIGYRDSDLYYYLRYGMSYLNMLVPITDWTIDTIKSIKLIKHPLIMAAAMWGLNTQLLAEGDNSFCVTGDTLVSTPDGLVEIKKLVGTSVKGIYPKNVELTTPLGNRYTIAVINNGFRKVRKMQLTNGLRLTATPNHPVLTLNEDLCFVWKELKDIEEGDYVVIDRNESKTDIYSTDEFISDLNFNKNLIEKLKILDQYKFFFVPVDTIEDLTAPMQVFDVSLPDKDGHFLSHAFYTNNIVSHNSYSGQSVSLDVDRTGQLESIAEKMRSYIDETFKNQKSNLVRAMPNGHPFHLGLSQPTVSGGIVGGSSGISSIAIARNPGLGRL